MTQTVQEALTIAGSSLAIELARQLGISRTTARRHLEALVAEGKASRSKGAIFRHGRYVPAIYYVAVESAR